MYHYDPKQGTHNTTPKTQAGLHIEAAEHFNFSVYTMSYLPANASRDDAVRTT